MTKRLRLILFAVIFLITYSCKKDIEQIPQYKRPDWLAGKVYTQIKAESDLTYFSKCLELTGYDTLLNTSGIYTIFAPDDNAFAIFFQKHTEYKKLEDIPISDLKKLVQAHIILDPWSLQQLQQLDIFGWIDSTGENNNKPRGFKRETLQVEKDSKYGVIVGSGSGSGDYLSTGKTYHIVDTLQSPLIRRSSADAGKYASIFYKKYFDTNNLSTDDYEYYFNRSFGSSTNMYYMGGKITKGDIFSENGFIHKIDKVIEPIQNVYEILKTTNSNNSYSEFLDLINTYSNFEYNETKTFAQPGAKQGKVVDSIFDIYYPTLTFDILNERTVRVGNVTYAGSSAMAIRSQNGIIAPTNEALKALENDYLVGSNKWGSIRKADPYIQRLIINSCMTNYPIYPSLFSKGFINGAQDKVFLDNSTVIQKQYASNATFIGVNKAIVPRAFNSVVGPALLDKRYVNSFVALMVTGLVSSLKMPDCDYSFFIESDANCMIDSSLIFENKVFKYFETNGHTKAEPKFLSSDNVDLRNFFLKHIGLETPKGIGRKEFIRTMGGNYLIVNNQTGEVSGTDSTRYGYGGPIVKVKPVQISSNAYNGKTYEISNWFKFTANDIYQKLSTSDSLSIFYALLNKAGYIDKAYEKITFLSSNNFYTVFAPTNSAFKNYNTDTLTMDELKKFLMLHFVQNNIIFTDGKKVENYYQTFRVDEKSTFYSTVYTKIRIKPGVDVIDFPDKTGNNYLSIKEREGYTNIITGNITLQSNKYIPKEFANGVVHFTNKVLLFNNLDTE